MLWIYFWRKHVSIYLFMIDLVNVYPNKQVVMCTMWFDAVCDMNNISRMFHLAAHRSIEGMSSFRERVLSKPFDAPIVNHSGGLQFRMANRVNGQSANIKQNIARYNRTTRSSEYRIQCDAFVNFALHGLRYISSFLAFFLISMTSFYFVSDIKGSNVKVQNNQVWALSQIAL